jgi:hypothetical protein
MMAHPPNQKGEVSCLSSDEEQIHSFGLDDDGDDQSVKSKETESS